MPDDPLKYKIGITLIPGIGSINAKKLISYTGCAEAVFSEKKRLLLKIPGIGEFLAESIIHQNVLEQADKEIEFLNRYEIKYHYYLDESYPERLKHCEDSPVLLFSKGDVDFNKPKVLSIVGTRNATEYGRECCNKLIEDLKARNHDVLIVSGLAYGIDICAHRSALKAGFDTVAVLGHGLSTIYPSAHKTTAREISKHGSLVTEFVSSTQPDRNNFVRRNRIVAGLADATLVVESGEKGGALITAGIAGSYNRDIFVFPGRTCDPYSKGCNWLLKTNKASLIENAEDLEFSLGWNSSGPSGLAFQTELFSDLSEEEKQIFRILSENGDLPIDTLCIQADMPTSKVSAMLLNLEFAGLVRSLPGKVYKAVGR